MDQHPDIKRFRNSLFPPQPSAICVTCGHPVAGFRDAISEKEHHISQMCQHCQDDVFADIEAVYEELGFDLDEEPTEERLVEWAQTEKISADTQRWIAGRLYTLAADEETTR